MLSTWFFLFWTFPILFVFKIILIIFNIFIITSFIIVILIITKVFQWLNKTKQADQWTVKKNFDQPWQSFSTLNTSKNHNKALLWEILKVEGSLTLWTFEIQGASHITFTTLLRLVKAGNLRYCPDLAPLEGTLLIRDKRFLNEKSSTLLHQKTIPRWK